MLQPDDVVDVVIVGAGVGGAALALALAHAHPLRVLVAERRSGPGYINRGDSLLPAVTRHLASWGALDRCFAAGANPVAKMQVYHHQRGFLMEAPLADPAGGHPYLVLPHPEIERVLADAARVTGRVEVRYLTRFDGLVEGGGGEDRGRGRVRGVRLRDRSGRETIVYARLVVGADGAQSPVRKALGLPLLATRYDHGYYIIDFERPAAYEDAMRLDLHPRGGIMTMPQRSGVVGAAVLARDEERDLFRAGTLEDKVAEIWRRSPLLRGQAPIPKNAHLYDLHRAHAPRYVARGAALIGDAIHQTNPTAGQGMTMAVEDAAALARIVGPALGAGASDADLDERLAAYERERRPQNAALVRWSHWMGRFFSAGGGLADGLRRNVFAFGQTAMGQYIQRSVWGRVATRKAS
jgi:2-polyprenyl-6-methoxyphenol hydroxylase-like FAD-dependent oxidoreductase